MTATATRRTTRRRNRQAIKMMEFDSMAVEDRQWQELTTTGRTVCGDYKTAKRFKSSWDDRYNGRICYIKRIDAGWSVKVIHEDVNDPPQLSPVLDAVCMAEELGVSVESLADRRDSRKASRVFSKLEQIKG